MRPWIAWAVLAGSLSASWPARAEPVRILVAASHSRGEAGEAPLLHSAEDVDRVESVLMDLGGFRRDDTITLADPTAAMLHGALDRARALAASHPPQDVTFLFYFSGHGDRDDIHLGDEAVRMMDVASRVETIPAALRIIVTDACRTYPGRPKGITTEPGFAIERSESHPGDGVVRLFSSADGEPALESDELRGGVFTHYWVSALRGAGDANGDGRVTLAESYDFAYSQTLLRSASAIGVAQHPAAVFDLRQAAPIVLTRTDAASASVRFPPVADTRFLLYELGSRTVLGEVWGRPDRDVVFALDPGRYLVLRTGGGSPAGVELSLAAGESRALRLDEFRAVATDEVAAKGGGVILRRSEMGVEVDVGASLLSTLGAATSLRYAFRLSDWAFACGLSGTLGFQHTSAEDVRLASVGADAEIERWWSFGTIGVALGVGAEGDLVWQTLQRTDAVRVAAAGYPTTQRFTGFAPGPIAVARLRDWIGLRTWVEVAARGGVLLPELGSSPGAMWTARVGIGTGLTF